MDTTTKTITGHEAIEIARAAGVTLSKYQDPTEGAREGLSVEEAEAVAAEDPSLVYLEVDECTQDDAARIARSVIANTDMSLGWGDAGYGSDIESARALVGDGEGLAGELAAREVASLLLEHDVVQCIYCAAEVPADHAEQVPEPDDDAWAEMAKDHGSGCEWIETRSHQLEAYERDAAYDARLAYLHLFGGSPGYAGEYEQQALSIGSEFLPEVARKVRDGELDEPPAEYWQWLCAQVEEERA